MPERNELIARQEVRWQITDQHGQSKRIVVGVGERVHDKLPTLTRMELDRLVKSGHITMPEKVIIRRRG